MYLSSTISLRLYWIFEFFKEGIQLFKLLFRNRLEAEDWIFKTESNINVFYDNLLFYIFS